METLDELRKQAEETRERLREEIVKIQDIFHKIAEEIGDNGRAATGEAVRLAEKQIEEAAFRVERHIDKTIALIPGDNVDNSETVIRQMDFNDFTNVDIDCAYKVNIVYSDSYRVTVRMSEELLDNINIAKSGSTLKLSLKPYRFSHLPVLEAEIAMPRLNRLRMGAATRGSVSGFNSKMPFALNLSGNSHLDINIEANTTRCEVSGASRLTGKIKTNEAELVLSGASRAELIGSAQEMTLSAWGASKADMEAFSVFKANISLKGASKAKVDVSSELSIDLGSGSNLDYLGNPQIHEVNVAGASSLNRI
jgi:hypothetical protein